MTLFKQIIIIMTIFQTIIFGFVMLENFNNINSSVQAQLSVDAMHTANSLGLSITPYAAQDDLATIQTMINSMFDSGYYETITLHDVNGTELVRNHQDIVIADVPSWFVNMFNIKAPVAKSEIMAGWRQFGVLSVKDNAGIAYKQLWDTFKDIASTFVIITLAAFLILYFSLKVILKPLKKVQEQAEAITGNDFIFQKDLPKTMELKQVVGAMNAMVGKVKEIFEKEADTVKQYTELLYKDATTKLPNRRFFTLKLKEYLKSDEESLGLVVFASLSIGRDIKEILGYKKSEEFYLNVAEILNEVDKKYEFAIISRMKDNDFALMFPSFDKEKVEKICNTLSLKLKNVLDSYSLDENEYFFNFGVTPYKENLQISDIFSKADFALTNAKSQGGYKISYDDDTEEDIALGKEAWRHEIESAIDEKRFIFATQKIVDAEENTYHNELFLRLKDKQGNIKNAAYFIPMINELKLNDIVDRYVVEYILNVMQSNVSLSAQPISINIGKEILLNPSSLDWFEKSLQKIKQNKINNVSFEISNRIKIDTQILAKFSKLLRSYGFSFGLDNFDINGDNLKILQNINPTYIKILSSTLLDLLDDKNATSSKQSLDIITQSMDIQIIAFGVESEQEVGKLTNMGITHMQGSYIEEPHLL